jgi:outer membrane protein assembly factor BamE (lipoprotein component of BamABCDE complex)
VINIRIAVLMISALGLLTLASCSREVGTPFNRDAVRSIKVGETTQGQVIALLGEPAGRQSPSSSKETWIYTYVSVYMRPTMAMLLAVGAPPTGKSTSERVTIEFHSGIVADCSIAAHSYEGENPALPNLSASSTIVRKCSEPLS